jgi:hypothetical protein
MKSLFVRKPIITDEQVALEYTRETILSDLRTMNADNHIVEVRMLKTPKGIVSGYFNDMEMLCNEILPCNGVCNIFYIFNQRSPSITAAVNQLHPYAKNTTTDSEIENRNWLFIDIDPVRKTDTSSTDEELNFALQAAVEVEDFLTANSFPAPVIAMSGNGAHLFYKINMGNDDESTTTIKAFLNVLDVKFSSAKVDIDTSVYSAAQLTKLYGTMAVKGEDTPERPHRQSKIIDAPETIETVSAEQIQDVTALLVPSAQTAARVKKTRSIGTKHDKPNSDEKTMLPEHLTPYNNLLTAEKYNMLIDGGGNIQILQGGKTNPHWAKMANFVPVPLEIIYEIDGTGNDVKQTITKISGWLEGTKELKTIAVNKDDFFKGKWFIDLDFRAYVNSDVRGGYDKIREVVQIFSDTAPKTKIYNHLGFRVVDGKLCYLHARGAVGHENVSVNLEQNNLSGYELEDVKGMPPDDKVVCINESLKIFDIHRYGNVLFAYSFLAPLCDMFAKHNNAPPFSLWICGKSDTQKSSVAALLLHFFGKDFSKNSLPLSFNDTENSMTKKLSLCKDVLAVIDDVVHPTANHGDINKQKRLAQNMIFNVANRTGRGRMNGDESLKKTHIPNGLVLFTAEYPLDNISESTTARLLCVEFEKGSVNLNALTECQNNTLNLNRTMACYIEWLIQNTERLTAELQQKFEELRLALSDSAGTDTNKKLIEVCAFMHISMNCVLQYFIETGAVDDEYKTDVLCGLDADLQMLIEKQSAALVATSPTRQFIDAVESMFALNIIYTKDTKGGILELPSGKTWVGWHDHNNYYFPVGENTGGVYVAVKQYLRQHEQAFDVQPKELFRRLVDEGIITDTEKGRYSRVKTINGKSERVLTVPKSVFNSAESKTEDLDDNPFDDDDPLKW